jgi:hypothetical protein
MNKQTTDKKQTNPKAEQNFRFSGFGAPRYTQVPDELFDILMPHLTEAELKVTLYVIRRTFGFKKDSDDISLRQLEKGITTRDGKVLDEGTGLSKKSITSALNGLIAKGVIVKTKNSSAERGFEANTYALNILGVTREKTEEAPLSKIYTSPSRKIYTSPNVKSTQALVKNLHIQETEEQKTAKQETEETTTGTSEVEGVNKENVVVALINFGISKKLAEKWSSQNEPLYLQQKLDYAMFLLDHAPQKIKNPNGWLRKAIEEDYGEPDGFISQADIEEQERQYEIEQQRQEELARLEAARQQKKAQLEEENYQQWRDELSIANGTTQEDFELWERVLVGLKSAFIGSETVYNSFIANAEILSVQDDKVLLGVGSQYAVDKLNHRNNLIFEREFRFIFKKPMQVEFVVVGSPEPVPQEIEVENETGTGACQVACSAQ